MAASTDRDAFGGQADRVLGVVRRVEVHGGRNVDLLELIEEDASLVGRIEDGDGDLRIGIGGTEVTVGEQPGDRIVAVGADRTDE